MSLRDPTRHYYRHELLSDDEHTEFLSILKELPCMVMISGYWSVLYCRELDGWRTATFDTTTRAGVVEEWLWMNFPAPEILHDCRFAGANYREREKIKKQKTRWVNRFASMTPLQRQVIREALREVA